MASLIIFNCIVFYQASWRIKIFRWCAVVNTGIISCFLVISLTNEAASWSHSITSQASTITLLAHIGWIFDIARIANTWCGSYCTIHWASNTFSIERSRASLAGSMTNHTGSIDIRRPRWARTGTSWNHPRANARHASCWCSITAR